MKILVIDFAASDGGALTILKNFYEEAKKDKKNTYIFLVSGNYLKSTNNIKQVILNNSKNHLFRIKFDFFNGKKLIKRYTPDMILSLQNTIVRGVHAKQILYIHQSIPFQKNKKFSFFKKQEFKYAKIQHLLGFLIKQSIKKADAIIVQTHWMQAAIISQKLISKDKIFVVPPSIPKLHYSQPTPQTNHFFYPTSNYPYKNNQLLENAANILQQKHIENFTIEITINGKSTKNIQKTGKIKHAKVLAKYSNTILVFPSYIETFGLPLLEARNAGTIILASDMPFSHEILDDYENAYFFNPFSESELALLMEKCISNKITLKTQAPNNNKQKILTIAEIAERILK